MRRLSTLVAVLAVQLIMCARPLAPTSAAADAVAHGLAASEVARLAEEFAHAQTSAVDKSRARRGVAQVAALWQPTDGDLAEFCRAQFVPHGPALDRLRTRMGQMLEQIDGHLYAVTGAAKWHTDVDTGAVQPVDELWSGFDVSAHVTEDLFKSRLAFVALLNFSVRTLEDKARDGARMSRTEWAEDRLTSRFAARVPGDLIARTSAVESAADAYVANYNLWMGHIVGADDAALFPKDMRLISHWNLRDEGKAAYGDPNPANGLAKQRLLTQVMERIVTQTIPRAVIDSPAITWAPAQNRVAPVATSPAKFAAVAPDATEGAARYQHILNRFIAERAIDAATPFANTKLKRAFSGAGLPEARVRELLVALLEAPVAKDVAAVVAKRLGRPLEPFDLWYTFRGADIAETSLDAKTKPKYPSAAAFAADMPRLLQGLGFTKARADYLAGLIEVDPSRGAGHAMPALRRGEKPRLRTRVGPDGMDYKGYNIAIHELGHNVEQVFSLYDVDDPLLAGVPNTAFTEALAFLFQARDRELLGLGPKTGSAAQAARVLNEFWNAREIAGPALLELEVWNWLYQHPDATAAELRDTTVRLAKALWKKYYAPYLGEPEDGTSLLGIYSHSVAIPLYLFNYVLGHTIAFSVEESLRDASPAQFAQKFEAMARIGSIGPDAWLTQATGHGVRADDLIAATRAALAN